ncbi:MAG: hypothetical protein ACHQ1H_04925 [Nitrososphaerales archaeon]
MTDWLFKRKVRGPIIAATLERYQHSTTSRYVKAEFKKGPLQYLIYLHNKLLQVQTVDQLFEAISKLGEPHGRRLRSILEHFTHFFAHAIPELDKTAKTHRVLSHDEYLLNIGRSYFANLIERSWEEFDLLTNEVIDDQRCFPDMLGPQRHGQLYSNLPRTCDKSSVRCGCRAFYNEHIEQFASICEALVHLSFIDEETRRRIHSLKEILRKPKRLREKDCWTCGDAVVVVEAPPGSVIFNNNMKHFEPICNALTIRVVTY